VTRTRATLLVTLLLASAWLLYRVAGPDQVGIAPPPVESPSSPEVARALPLPAGPAESASPAASGPESVEPVPAEKDPERPEGPVVTGEVADAAGKPIAGATVAILAPGADWRRGARNVVRTGRDGHFVITVPKKLEGKAVRIVVDHVAAGYVLEEYVMETLLESHVSFVLQEGLEIAGVVTGPDGEPLPEVVVNILEDYRDEPPRRRPAEGRVATDKEGRFRDNAFRPGIYRIFLSGEIDGHEFGAVHTGLSAGDTALRLGVPGFGAVKLLFEDDQTSEGLRVDTVRIDYVWDHTGAEERFVNWVVYRGVEEVAIRHLPEGHYRLRVRRSGYQELVSDLLWIAANHDLGLLRLGLSAR
jgi:hypothetical protein